MKMWLAAMLLLTGFHPANAEPAAVGQANPADYREVPIPADYTYTDPEVGSVRVQALDAGEPAKMPLRMTVTATNATVTTAKKTATRMSTLVTTTQRFVKRSR